MSFNPVAAPDDAKVEVALSVFGSLVTEIEATNLPEGVSPDCQDVVFTPGSVASRPGLARVFPAPFPGTLTYAKSYIDPLGTIRNLYLDSTGGLWVENVSSSPEIRTMLASTIPGSYARSITAFGREYIGISDGLHGADVPLQYDGTNLDRVTQDGPGAPPTVASISLPSVAMVATSAPAAMTVTEIDPEGFDGTAYTALAIFVTDTLQTQPGDVITVAGNTVGTYNAVWTVTAVYGTTLLWVAGIYLLAPLTFGTGGTATASSGTTMTRAGNVVTVKTAAANGLKIGYQAQITGVPAKAIGGGITAITINNEDSPGLATATTATAHGLVPGLFVTLTAIAAVGVGGAIVSVARAGQIVTVTMTTAHGLSPGASVTLAGVGDASFNTTVIVSNVNSPTVFVFLQVAANATSSGGTLVLNWPIPDTATPTYFEVIAAPTATKFQVQVNYSDGTWTTGVVKYAWDGIFFVSNIVDPTTFQYQQYGPNATATTVGTVTPYGQAAPGKHQMQVLFLTRQGYITRGSPPVPIIFNGGQYVSVTNIPIGPSNVVSRILAFTGALGSLFFYIPVPAQVNGQVVSTATQINDNTTTSVTLDFSDNTLFAALGISIPGNNLANEIVLDGALGFGFYASRLLTYGQRNTIQNLINLGFDGGAFPSSPTLPCGWVQNTIGGALSAGHYGTGWLITVTPATARGHLFQSFYLDAYQGAPIGTGNTLYKLRVWLKPSALAADLIFHAEISSASTAFVSQVNIPGTSMSLSGSFIDVTFDLKTPDAIPADLNFSIWAQSSTTSATLLVDEIAIIFADNPYRDTIINASYANNPEGFDGVSGVFGPVDDTRKVMGFGIVRRSLYLLTQEPSGRLHSTSDNGTTEPAGWTIDEVGANCGALSAFCITTSQADDASAGGGEEWLAWASLSGARMFGGDQPWKISQEIQPDWESVNSVASLATWALNDPVARVIYFGLPTGSNSAPSLIYPVNYRELDTPYQIAMSPPVHTSSTGKLVATDNTRKWTRWNVTANGAAMMYRSPGALQVVLFGGNGSAPGSVAGPSNAYTLAPGLMTDQDYGLIQPYYATFFFVSKEAGNAMGLGVHQMTLEYLISQISGVGKVVITPLVNNLLRVWPLTCVRTLAVEPQFDLEWGGGAVTCYRVAFKIASVPVSPNTDNAFVLNKLVATLKAAASLPVRGSAS